MPTATEDSTTARPSFDDLVPWYYYWTRTRSNGDRPHTAHRYEGLPLSSLVGSANNIDAYLINNLLLVINGDRRNDSSFHLLHTERSHGRRSYIVDADRNRHDPFLIATVQALLDGETPPSLPQEQQEASEPEHQFGEHHRVASFLNQAQRESLQPSIRQNLSAYILGEDQPHNGVYFATPEGVEVSLRMLEHADVTYNISRSNNLILEFTTDNVVLMDRDGEERNLGRYKCELVYSSGGLACHVHSAEDNPSDFTCLDTGHVHPNVSDDYRLCFGEGESLLFKALCKGHLETAVNIIKEILNTYGWRSPHRPLENWRGQQVRCHNTLQLYPSANILSCDCCRVQIARDSVVTTDPNGYRVCSNCECTCSKCGRTTDAQHTYLTPEGQVCFSCQNMSTVYNSPEVVRSREVRANKVSLLIVQDRRDREQRRQAVADQFGGRNEESGDDYDEDEEEYADDFCFDS